MVVITFLLQQIFLLDNIRNGFEDLDVVTSLTLDVGTLTLAILLILSQVRVEQVIVADPGPVVLYKLTNLLKFYLHTVG